MNLKTGTDALFNDKVEDPVNEGGFINSGLVEVDEIRAVWKSV